MQLVWFSVKERKKGNIHKKRRGGRPYLLSVKRDLFTLTRGFLQRRREPTLPPSQKRDLIYSSMRDMWGGPPAGGRGGNLSSFRGKKKSMTCSDAEGEKRVLKRGT